MKHLRLIAYIICLIAGKQAMAQVPISTKEEAEKTWRILKSHKPDIEQINMQLALADWLIADHTQPSGRIDSANTLASQAYQTSKRLEYQEGEGKSSFQLCRIAQINHHYEEGKAFASAAIDIFSKIDKQDALGEAWVMLWSNNTLAGLAPKLRIPFLEKAAAAFKLAGNKKREADCCKEAGDLYQMNYDLPKALEVLQRALLLRQETKDPDLVGIYDLLGTVFFRLGDYQSGVEYGLKAVQTAETLGDTNTVSMCTYYNRIGSAYLQMNDTANCRVFLKKALDIAIKFDDHNAIGNLTYNMVQYQLRYRKANAALELLQSIIKRYPDIAVEFAIPLDAVFITAYLQLAAYEKALPYVISLEKQSLQPGIDAETVPIIYAALVSYYLATRQNQKAMASSLKHKAAIEKITRPDVISLYYLLRFRVDSATGQYISAIQNFQRYKAIKDSLLTETKTRQIAQLGILYETEKKEKNIQTLQRSAEIQQNNLRQANIRQTLALIGAALLLIIAGLLYYGYRLKRKSNSALLRQQQEISEKNEVLQSLVTEKDWLMREIHHRVKNNLHMVVGLLASQAEYIKGKEALDAINESQHRVQAMSIIHQKLYQTDNLSFTDMSEYIHELVDYLQSSFDKSVSIRFILDIAKVDFPLSLSIPLGLIINEAVTNSIKYAFPDKRNGEIHITLKEQASGHFQLSIHDNGVGVYDSLDMQKTASLGVSLIKGLSDDIKGQLTIQNDKGLKIEITFPSVKNDESHE